MTEHRCRQALARNWRCALVRALTDHELAAMLARVGEVRSGRRVVEGGLPADPRTAAELCALLARVVAALRRDAGTAPLDPQGAVRRKLERALGAVAEVRRVLPLHHEAAHAACAAVEFELGELAQDVSRPL